MFWDDEDEDQFDDEKPETIMQRFFRACLLALAGVVALWIALQLLAQIWGWLLLAAALSGLIWAFVRFIRWRRDGRW